MWSSFGYLHLRKNVFFQITLDKDTNLSLSSKICRHIKNSGSNNQTTTPPWTCNSNQDLSSTPSRRLARRQRQTPFILVTHTGFHLKCKHVLAKEQKKDNIHSWTLGLTNDPRHDNSLTVLIGRSIDRDVRNSSQIQLF